MVRHRLRRGRLTLTLTLAPALALALTLALTLTLTRCASCLRLGAELAPLLAGGANPRLQPVTFDGGGSPPERALLLAHEVEVAGAITGVHRAAWVGAALQNPNPQPYP